MKLGLMHLELNRKQTAELLKFYLQHKETGGSYMLIEPRVSDAEGWPMDSAKLRVALIDSKSGDILNKAVLKAIGGAK